MRKRQAIWILTPPLFIFVGLFLVWTLWLKQKVITYALSQIPKINEMQNVVQINVNDLDISLLKLQATAKNIDVLFINDLNYLTRTKIDSIKLQVDPFSLMIGQLEASYIQINSLQWNIPKEAYSKLFQSSSQEPTQINLEPIFKHLPDIPIKNIYIANSRIQLSLPPSPNHSIAHAALDLSSLQITNQKKAIDLIANKINVIAISNVNGAVDVSAQISARIEQNAIQSLNIEVSKNNTSLRINLTTDRLRTLLFNPYFEGQAQGEIQLVELRNIAYLIKNTDSRLPQMNGEVRFNSNISTQGIDSNEGNIHLRYSDINIDTLKFGNGEFSSKIKNNQFDIDRVTLLHPSGQAELKKIVLENKSPYKFKTEIVINEFSLQKLFLSINEKTIPVFLDVKATASCEGQIESFSAICTGQLNAENVDVFSDMKKELNIVSIKRAFSKVKANLNADGVEFENTVEFSPGSAFSAKGRVGFKTGFNMEFKSDGLNLDDIQNIADLKLKGIASGSLEASGDSDHGIIDSELSLNKASISDFFLGDITTHFNYRNGLISLTRLNARMGESLYHGQIDVDVDNKRTRGDFKFSHLRVVDALEMIEEKWHLPLRATGTGLASVSFSGPLDFWKLNLKISAGLFKGTIYDESFTKLNAEIESNGSKMDFKNVILSKTTGSVIVSQHIDTSKPEPEFNLKISSQNLKVEDIDYINGLFKNVSGNLQINGSVTGPLDQPSVVTHSQVNQFQIDNFRLPNSQIDSELNKKYFHANGQVFGRQIQADIKIPFVEQEGYAVKAKLNDFQPLLLLPLIDIPLPEYDIKSQLSANIDITTKKNDFTTLTGRISIDQFNIERGLQIIKLTQPTEILYRDGAMTMGALNLAGPDQNLSLQLRNQNGEQRLFTHGRLFLKPLQFLVPFTDNLTGVLEFSTYIGFKNGRPLFSGEGLINDATITAKGFPYPITNTSAFFDLYDSKIEFTDITANLNQARLIGQGLVDMRGPKNIRVDLNMDSEELELEFPSKILTAGMAKIRFSGDWLPYTLNIDYDISHGLVTKEFTGDAEETNMVLPPSSLLPASQLESSTQAMLLNVKTQFPKGIVIKNSLMEGSVAGYLNITGTPNTPIMTGVINVLPGSKLNFKDKPFEIKNGVVRFNGTKDINPEVSLTANARVTDYDIALDINGPAKSLDIKPSSQPPLSQNDIFSLLALGYTTSDETLAAGQNVTSETQQRQTGLEVLSAIGNSSEFSKKIQSRLGVNVQLAPSIDNTRNIAVPKVIVSKQLSKKIYTSYGRSLVGDRQNNEVKLQWLFHPNASAIVSYQNQPNILENTNILNQENEVGVGGLDLEYKWEFD